MLNGPPLVMLAALVVVPGCGGTDTSSTQIATVTPKHHHAQPASKPKPKPKFKPKPPPPKPKPPPPPPPTVDVSRPARQLATLDGDSTLEDDFANYLTSLAPRCRENPEALAHLIFGTQQDMKKSGVDESLLSITKALNTSVPKSLKDFDCRGALAAYDLLRTQG